MYFFSPIKKKQERTLNTTQYTHRKKCSQPKTEIENVTISDSSKNKHQLLLLWKKSQLPYFLTRDTLL
jgi:hypothetical protein